VKNIDAGSLRHRITLSRKSTQPADKVGQPIPTYQDIGNFYALVECLGGAESTNAAQLKGVLRYTVLMRASSGPVRPSDKLVWQGHTLQVTAAVTDPFNIFITVDAIELPAQ
jgi:head-tail adaptor